MRHRPLGESSAAKDSRRRAVDGIRSFSDHFTDRQIGRGSLVRRNVDYQRRRRTIETLKHLFQVNSRTALLMAAISQGVLEVKSSEPNISEEIFRALGKERPPADSSYCE